MHEGINLQETLSPAEYPMIWLPNFGFVEADPAKARIQFQDKLKTSNNEESKT